MLGATRLLAQRKNVMTTIQTTHKTFNKTIKGEIVRLMPSACTVQKLHVAGIGYAFYVKNNEGETIGKVWKERGKGMKIAIN